VTATDITLDYVYLTLPTGFLMEVGKFGAGEKDRTWKGSPINR